MEGECVQVDMDRLAALPDDLLLPVGSLPSCPGRRPKEDFRKSRGILPQAHVLESAVVRLGFLRHDRNEQMVESVHLDTLARLYRGFRVGHHPR